MTTILIFIYFWLNAFCAGLSFKIKKKLKEWW